MFKKILVGYDGSKFSDAALNEALRLAKDSDGQITVICAMERNYEMEAMAPELERKFEEKADEDLRQAEAIIKRAGVKYKREEVTVDSPYKAIVAAAQNHKSDLIVLGTHGRTGLMRLLMGSTAERVIGHAPCNVLIVRSRQEEK
jgi:nucleotide-binding universal stress UspA family protein